MREQAQRMQALVADLLTLAQLEGSPRPPADRWVPVSNLLAQARADAQALSAGAHVLEFAGEAQGADEAGMTWSWELAGSVNELHSALGNLVSNAVRYTPSHGLIRLSWRVREDGSGEFEVSDTGLGLAIVKHVMQRHGGEVRIESEIGQGARFRLVFPPARLRRALLVAAAPAGGATAEGESTLDSVSA
jgi:two-component system phosphate regulon sensor histidine kinase PhoR